jgi:hypothetical protein
MKIERDKWYLMRNGDKARCVCIDADARHPIVLVDTNGDTIRLPASGARGCYYDLVAEYIPPKKPEVRYVNIYEDSDLSTCASRHREYVEGYRHNRGYVRTVQMVEVTPEVEAALKEKGVEY